MKSRGLLAGTVVCGLLVGFLILAQVYCLTQIVYGAFLGGQGLRALAPWFAGLLTSVTLRSAVSWLEEALAIRLAHRVEGGLRAAVLDKLVRIGPVRLRDEQTGELLYLATEGMDVLNAYFGKYLPQLFKSGLLPVLFLIYIFPRDWITGLILLLTAPLLPMFMMLIGKWSQTMTRKQWGVLSKMTGFFQDLISGIATLKTLNRSRDEVDKVEEISEDFRRTSLSVLRIAFLSAFTMELFSTLSIALVSVGLGIRLVNGYLNFHDAFILLLLAPEFYQPIRNLGTQYHASQNGVAAAERVYDFLGLPEGGDCSFGESPLPEGGDLTVAFDRVSCRYEGERGEVLHQVSFVLNPGERVAMVGPSGGGKTTILQLLLGFLEPTEGEISVNGRSLKEFSLEEWRRHVAWVSQKPYLFAGTIRENILLGNDKTTPGEFENACALLGLDSFVNLMPEGYDTPVGQGGRGLSGGQRQLVSIARAWLRKAPVILLDEATANLDLIREAEVSQALDVLMKGKTVLAAAHRLQTVRGMDRIMVVENGEVTEQGRYEELAAQESHFAALIQAADQA